MMMYFPNNFSAISYSGLLKEIYLLFRAGFHITLLQENVKETHALTVETKYTLKEKTSKPELYHLKRKSW